MKAKEFIFWLICVVGAVLCSFWIVDNFTASSEVLGSLNRTSSDLVFVIQTETIVMTKETDDKYSISKEFSSVYQVNKDFDADKNEYEFVLNDLCFANTEIMAGQVKCDLTMTFLDTTGEDILTDTLYITINFYSGSTILDIHTLGGSQANAYWLSYFNSYGFDMRVYQI